MSPKMRAASCIHVVMLISGRLNKQKGCAHAGSPGGKSHPQVLGLLGRRSYALTAI